MTSSDFAANSDTEQTPLTSPEPSELMGLTRWSQFTDQRASVAATLDRTIALLETAEAFGQTKSGSLGLDQPIYDLQQTADSLSNGTYRLMVMGDMKRGKSTLLNALIGEPVLPSDVNPCTALLTVLRYGPEKRIVLHYKGERSPEDISLESFKEKYVISPTESKRLEEQGTEAFPEMSHVVVEYPLPLLANGIELIDTPGLNDTEARNQQVLSYLNDCQAVLFVLGATQPFTLDERRYLNNYLKNSGLALFFIVNGWDRIRSGLFDPEDETAVAEAEAKVRQVFETNLADYKLANYQADKLRLFEVSALQALRQRVKGQSLAGSGLIPLIEGLDHFLAYERGSAELNRTLSVASRAYRAVSASIARRIPLLDESLEGLEDKVSSVQSDFGKLEQIRDRYCNVIGTSRDHHAKKISASFSSFILQLEKTFERDFVDSQPNLDFLDFLEASKRQKFYREFKRAFERYINDRLAAWEFTAKQTIGEAFDQLNESAADYQVAYAEVVEVIQEKIMGNRFYAVGQELDPSQTRIWADNVKDIFEDIPHNLNSGIRSFNYFWQSVFQLALVSVCATIMLQLLSLIFSSLFLNIVGVILAAGGIFAVQAELVRQEFLKATKKAFVQQLPRIAKEQTPSIEKAVRACFDAYEERAIDRINADITARRAELDNLVSRKQQHEINREQEIARLQELERQMQENISAIAAEID